MTVYVVLYHDVWDIGRHPGYENENGEPETTTIEHIYESRASAEAFIQHDQDLFPNSDRAFNFYTIEEHQTKP